MKVSLISMDTVMICYGLRSISSILREAEHETQMFLLLSKIEDEPQYAERTIDQLAEMVKGSDLIGVSCMVYTSDRCKQVLRRLRKFNIPIIWGGIHATLNPEECLDFADIVCIGEGEETIVELVDHLEQGKDWKHIQNLAYRENGNVVVNDVRPLIQDLDSFPFPDYDGENHYILQDQELVQENEYDYSRRSFNRWILLHTARGCVHSCSYCCNSYLKKLYSGKGKLIRKRSVEKCIQEMEYIRRVYPDRESLWITDDTFFVRTTEELEEFGTKFKERIGLPYRCNGTPSTITEEKLAPLVETGLFQVRVGIQTGSERVANDVFRRFISNDRIRQAADDLNKFQDKMIPSYHIIITNPYEEREDVLDSINLIRELPTPFQLDIFNLIFFPGNDLYQWAIRDGHISGKEDSYYNFDFHDHEQIKHLQVKPKNRYLNSVVYSMRGFAKENRVGAIPRFLFPFLLSPIMINLMEKFPSLNDLNLWFFGFVRKAYYFFQKALATLSADAKKADVSNKNLMESN